MKNDPNELKLIYVHKIGYDALGDGVYQFIFAKDSENIDGSAWGWEDIPASTNATPPDKEHIEKVLNLKTNLFDLVCLHEANDRPYMHGYHTIHALAYENEDVDEISVESEFDMIYDQLPLLVFHFGMPISQVCDIFYERDIVLDEENNKFIHNTEIKI
jgi:hypothetical protein